MKLNYKHPLIEFIKRWSPTGRAHIRNAIDDYEILTACNLFWYMAWASFAFLVAAIAMAFCTLAVVGSWSLISYEWLRNDIPIKAIFDAMVLGQDEPMTLFMLLLISSEIIHMLTLVIAALGLCAWLKDYSRKLKREARERRSAYGDAEQNQPGLIETWWKELKEKTCIYVEIVK